MRLHNLIFDPIPFKGGSKIATSEALSQCQQDDVHFTIVTVDKAFWQQSELAANHEIKIISITAIPWLSRQCSGVWFWLNQLYFCLLLAVCLIRINKVDRFIAASGPGVDMSLYLVNYLLNKPIIQLIHGDVATSGAIGWCLTQTEKVFYLPSTKQSLNSALMRYFTRRFSLDISDTLANQYLNLNKFQPFVNGLSQKQWPSRCRVGNNHCFWAASLLKWKGLDLFVDALRSVNQELPTPTTVCYIKPKNINLNISEAPVPVPFTEWFHDPANLDELRQQCGIFVSTSTKEPFGLSILESLAAGQCVLIPQDGSYWDTQLTDGENCIKYMAGDADELAAKLIFLQLQPQKLEAIQIQAFKLAKQYQAEDCYRSIVTSVSQFNSAHAQAASIVAEGKKG